MPMHFGVFYNFGKRVGDELPEEDEHPLEEDLEDAQVQNAANSNARQTSGAMTGSSKPSAAKDEKKETQPLDFDIDMGSAETEKAAVAIQSQFRKFQKKKQDVKS
ncbi:calmodulin regulator protein PCP4a [Diretmus argenteus]